MCNHHDYPFYYWAVNSKCEIKRPRACRLWPLLSLTNLIFKRSQSDALQEKAFVDVDVDVHTHLL